jgi:hypothetical protein
MRYIFLFILFSNLLSGQNYENNIIPVGNKELRFVNSSMIPYNVLKNNYTSKVRKASETFTVVIPSAPTTTNSLNWSQGTSLTSTVNGTPSTVLIPSGSILNVIGYNSFGLPVYQPISSLISTTHTLSSSINTLTSTVNGITATAPVINSNSLTWNSTNGLLTSTINGIAATATIPRVSQAFPLQNGVLDTRNGAIGTTGTNIYAAWNHQHPLVALTVPALGNCAVSGSGGTLVSQSTTRVRATEETVTYTIQVTTTNTSATAWLTITPPAITGFYLTKVINAGTYDASAANLAPYFGTHPSFVWAGTTVYLRPRAINLTLVHNIILEYTLN